MEIAPKVSAGVIVLKLNLGVAFDPLLKIVNDFKGPKTLGSEIFRNLLPTLDDVVGIEGIGIELAILMQTTTSGPASVRVFAVIRIAIAVNVVVRHFLNMDAGFHTIFLAFPTFIAIGSVLSDNTGHIFVFGFDGKGTNLVDGAVNGNSKLFHILKFYRLYLLYCKCHAGLLQSVHKLIAIKNSCIFRTDELHNPCVQLVKGIGRPIEETHLTPIGQRQHKVVVGHEDVDDIGEIDGVDVLGIVEVFHVLSIFDYTIYTANLVPKWAGVKRRSGSTLIYPGPSFIK